jgi:ATP-dependent helicase HrpB
MASLLGEEVGKTVGYVTRDDRRISRSTRIEVVTDGILTRRLQHEPDLPGVAMVIFDEFHERRLAADLGLSLTLDARSGLRPELRVLVMSATLDVESIADLLGGAPVILSRGRSYPVALRWKALPRPGALTPAVAAVVNEALQRDAGDILAFLPGVGEIRAVASALGNLVGIQVMPLHGGLSAEEQDRALRSGLLRRVVLSTDVAETSVTVEGVGVVVDAGLARRPVYDPATGLSRLRTVRTSRASADQRSGRAGRTAPGIAYRLWSEVDHLALRQWSEPEILSAELAALVLELSVWGATAASLRWLDPPPSASVATAQQLLEELGALEYGRPTGLGRRLVELPVHPRLARMLVAAPRHELRAAALLAALLSERDVFRRATGDGAPSADVASRLAVLAGAGALEPGLVDRSAVATVRRRAGELIRRVEQASVTDRAPIETLLPEDTEHGPGRLLALAYPDRIAQRRGVGRYRLRNGGGAVLPAHDPLASAEWLVAVDVEAGAGRTGRADGQVRLAAALERSDVDRIGAGQIQRVVRVQWDEQLDDLRATEERKLDALVLDAVRSRVQPGPETTAALVAHAARTRLAVLGWSPASRSLQARVAWARRVLGESWPDVSDTALTASAPEWLTPLLKGARGRSELARVDPSAAIRAALGGRSVELEQLLPPSLELPGGRRTAIAYDDDRPRAAVRVQDLFGVGVHPRVAGGSVPITLELLSPAGRPIQITDDLPRFWSGSWREVRREMIARYPKHSWPDNPAAVSPPSRRTGVRRDR